MYNDETRKRSFNGIAENYDAYRPGYAPELYEALIRTSGVPPGGEILDIGCGTGQSARPFVERGYRMTCLDIGPETVAKARENFRGLPNVSVLLTSFEEWAPAHNNFDLVTAGAAFHWLKPGVRFPKIAGLLKPGGALAMFTNQHKPPREGFFAEVQEIYARVAPGLKKQAGKEGEPPPEEGTELFGAPLLSRYPWEMAFTAKEYVGHIGTFSDHITLPDEVRGRLFAEIGTLIDAKYGGRVTKHFVSQLAVFKKAAAVA